MSNKRKYAEAIVEAGGTCLYKGTMNCGLCPWRDYDCNSPGDNLLRATKWLAKKEAKRHQEELKEYEEKASAKAIIASEDFQEILNPKPEQVIQRCTIPESRGDCHAYNGGDCMSAFTCKPVVWHWPTPDENTPVDTKVWVKDQSKQGWLKRHFADDLYMAWNVGCTCFTTTTEPDRWNYMVLANPANPDEVPPMDAGMEAGK
jgi:hypothetical protein